MPGSKRKRGGAAKASENTAMKAKKARPEPKAKKQEEEAPSHWLIKSEPEPRFENGVDVSYGIRKLTQTRFERSTFQLYLLKKIFPELY